MRYSLGYRNNLTMLNDEERSYLREHPQVRRLTFDGRNDLYLTRFGARTIMDAIEMDKLYAEYQVKLQELKGQWRIIPIHNALQRLDERCIAQCGCSVFIT